MTASGDDDAFLRAVAHAPNITPPGVERDARIGTTLRDKYTLERVLGEGGMAIVYEARHRNSKRFAIKVLRQRLSTSSEARTRFVREGYVANTVGHPGAVAILDDDVAEDGSAFIVMELLEGEPLDRLVSHEGASVRAAMAIGIRVLDVLVAAHDKGIVHRDIKPQNLFVTRTGDVKVLDFGIAQMRVGANAVTTTQAGTLMGTPAFMPPEQALGHTREVDAQSDVWSLGATLFTLLTGQLVHVGETSQEVAVRAATRPPRSVASVAPHVPADVTRILDRALAFSKSDRWPTAAPMRDALAAAYREHFGADPSPEAVATLYDKTEPLPVRSEKPRHRAVAAIVVLGAVLAVAMGVRFMTRAPVFSSANASELQIVTAPPSALAAPSTAPADIEATGRTPIASTTMLAAPSTHASTPAPKVFNSCSPPYIVEASGKRVPKPQCL